MRKLLFLSLLALPFTVQAKKLYFGISGGTFRNSQPASIYKVGNRNIFHNSGTKASVYGPYASVQAGADMGRWDAGVQISVYKVYDEGGSQAALDYQLANPMWMPTLYANRQFGIGFADVYAGLHIGYGFGRDVERPSDPRLQVQVRDAYPRSGMVGAQAGINIPVSPHLALNAAYTFSAHKMWHSSYPEYRLIYQYFGHAFSAGVRYTF